MNSFRLSPMRGTLLAATALGSVLAAFVGAPQAQAQFVCIGNATGAPVPPGAADGDGATAVGAGNNSFACGRLATANGVASTIASSTDISALNSQIAGINNQIVGINTRLNDLDGRTTKALNGVAMAFAISGVPWLQPTEHLAVSANYGTFQGTNGIALNAALRLSTRLQAEGGIAYGANGGGVGGRAGLRMGW